MYGYIYKITNTINSKIYIGQRKAEEFEGDQYLGSGKAIKNAIAKYGKDNFHATLLEACESKAALDEKEKFYIAEYRKICSKLMYNIANGGDGGDTFSNHSAEEKQKIKEKLRGKSRRGIKLSKEVKDKISAACKGKKKPEYFGKLISNRRIGSIGPMRDKAMSENGRRLIREAHLGKSLSENCKRKKSEKLKGKPRPATKKFECIETAEVFVSLGEMYRKTNYGIENIRLVLVGKRVSAYGLHWRYIN